MIESKYNHAEFTPEEVEDGLLQDLLNYLFKYNNSERASAYYDTHITTDGFCTIVEWCTVYKDGGGGSFQFVDENQTIYTSYRLPDNSYVDFQNEEDFTDYFTKWMKENPGWVQTPYGTWINEIENKYIRNEKEEK